MNQSVQPRRRPTGIVIIALLWTIVSIYNIYEGFNRIIIGYGILPILSEPDVHEWFSFGLPVEIMLGFFGVAYGLLTLLVVYGLYTAKSWSYELALALPVFILILNSVTMMLYATAPPVLRLGAAADAVIPFLIGNMVFLLFTWGYLTQSHVKQYLNRIPSPAPTPMPPPTLPVSPPLEPDATIEEKKFCRYCGAENKTDAVFCEKCGKKVG